MVVGALPVLVLGVLQVLSDGEDRRVRDLWVVYAHVESGVSLRVQQGQLFGVFLKEALLLMNTWNILCIRNTRVWFITWWVYCFIR